MRPQEGSDERPPERVPTATRLEEATRRADWDLVRSVYAQVVAIATDNNARFMPDNLVGYLAEAMARVAANYHGEEEEFTEHVLAVLASVEDEETLTPEVYRRLYADRRFERFKQYGVADAGGGTRSRPKPLETVVETVRRYRDVNCIESVLSTDTSGILGGSTSYGRFFNVAGPRADREASDLDLLVVVPGFATLPSVLDRLGHVDGLCAESLAAARDRAEVFRRCSMDDGRTVFSHRLDMWTHDADPVTVWHDGPSGYAVSLHVLSSAVLEWLLVGSAPRLDGFRVGRTRSIRDYRERTWPQTHDLQRCFSGMYRSVPTSKEEVEGGYWRGAGVFSIQDDRYFPGQFQNLVFPRFELRWDAVGARRALEAFRYKMIERLRLERMTRPYELQLFSLAHTRTEVFAPNVLRRIDGLETL